MSFLAIDSLIPNVNQHLRKTHKQKARSHVGIIQSNSYELITFSNLILLFFVMALMLLTLMLVIMLMTMMMLM